MADLRGNFKLMLNWNIYYLYNEAIFKYGDYSGNFKPNLLLLVWCKETAILNLLQYGGHARQF